MKKTITLEAIDPIELYGAGNKILTEFCSYFPHLKVGSSWKAGRATSPSSRSASGSWSSGGTGR